jgi:hypothetical protein
MSSDDGARSSDARTKFQRRGPEVGIWEIISEVSLLPTDRQSVDFWDSGGPPHETKLNLKPTGCLAIG